MAVQVEAQGAKVLTKLSQQEQVQEAKIREQEQAAARRAAEAEQKAEAEKAKAVRPLPPQARAPARCMGFLDPCLRRWCGGGAQGDAACMW